MKIGYAVVVLILLSLIAILMVERQRIDPIEKAVSETMGNENLVVGSKLGLWIDALGEPDIEFTYQCPCGKGIYFGWSKYGIAVTNYPCGESEVEKSSRGELLVDSIIIPIKKKVYNRYPGSEENKLIIFENTLDVKINGKSLSEMTFEEIDSLYHFHYDSSKYSIYLHKLPEYIAKRRAGIQYSVSLDEKQRGGNPDWSKDIEQITVSESGIF
jgi:hypothetical protein